ncbi:site-specific integrase [bacterium]|nr:site-specific integrase [bacterium]
MAIEVIRLKKGAVYKAVLYKNRHRISRCFDRKYDAQQWLDQQHTLHQYGYQAKITFFEACRIWLENHAQTRKSPRCAEYDRRMIDNSFKPYFGDVELGKVSPYKVEGYIAQLLSTGIKKATVNRYLQTLRALLNYFVKKRHLLVNPVSLVGLFPEEDASYDYLSYEEADQFLTYAEVKHQKDKRWIYLLYLLAINTGMRWGEIAALQWDRVDFKNQRITISRSYCDVSKQIRETTKGRKIRYVGINSSLMPELKAHYERSDQKQGLVFVLNGRVLDPKNFKRDRFEKDLREAEVKRIRFHDLRHSFASHFMMKGGNLYDLQKLMGHSDISTTERYAHLSPESLVLRTELVAVHGGKNNVIDLSEKRRQQA